MKNENIWTEIKENFVKIMLVEEQNKICSKIKKHKNYIIHLYNKKIIFSNTKKQYKNKFKHNNIPLIKTYHYNTFYFTYKKDWLKALKELE